MFKKINQFIWQLVWSLLLGTSAFAQLGDSRPQPAPTMRVIEFNKAPAEQAPPNYFTVVGAVERSAVYSSPRSSIPLRELIEAAKGMAKSASGNVRVMRDGRPRSQLIYGPGIDLPVFAGEVVVVVPAEPDSLNPATPSLTPVACFGLDQRPVVLYLNPGVNSLPVLNYNLMQAPGNLSSIRVIHPYNLPDTSPLVPGSLVYFDPATLNTRDLKIARSQREFPPTVSVEESLLPMVSPASPVESNTLPRQSASLAMPVSPVQQLAIPAAEPRSTAPLPPPALSAPELPLPLEESFSVESAPTPPPPPIEVVEEPFVGELRTIPTSVGKAPPRADQTSWVYSKPSVSPPSGTSRSPMASQLEPTPADAPASPEPNFALQEETAAIQATQGPENARTTGSIWPIALGVGFLTILCFGVSLAWSRWERMTPLTPHSRVPSTVDLDGMRESRSALAQLLDPQTPVIEEQIHQLAPSTLHGDPQGTRHLQVHDRHSQLAGPHFGRARAAKTQSTVDKAAERELRTALREAVRGRHAMSTVLESAESVEPVQHDAAPDTTPAIVEPRPESAALKKHHYRYDVVQPETEAEVSPRVGPLERALRSRARKHLG